MKKLYSLLLSVLILLTTSFQAEAASTTARWKDPGAIAYYAIGAIANPKVAVDPTATSLTLNPDDFTTTNTTVYVFLRDGFIANRISVVNPTTNSTVWLNLGSRDGYRVQYIDFGRLNGMSFDLDIFRLDTTSASINVNLINGSDKVTGVFYPTDRTISFVPGQQTVGYDIEHEQYLNITAPSTADNPASPSLVYNDIEMTWENLYNKLTLKTAPGGAKLNSGNGLELINDANLTITYDSTLPAEEPIIDEPDEPTTATVTMNYVGDDARSSILMIRNVTQNQSITDRNQFEVNPNDIVRFSFDTQNYQVTFDGQAVPQPESGQTFTNVEQTITESTTLTVQVAERDYGTTPVTLYVNDINNVRLYYLDSRFNEVAIDQNAISATGSTINHNFVAITEGGSRLSATLYGYTIDASLKYEGKVFVDAAEGCWLKRSQYRSIGDEDNTETNMATPSKPLCVLANQINKTTPLIVYFKSNPGVDIYLSDNHQSEFELVTGYNEFLIDPDYQQIRAGISWHYDEGEQADPDRADPTMTFMLNGIGYSPDDNGVYSVDMSSLNPNQGHVMHVVAGEATTVTVNAQFTADKIGAPKVVVDRVREITANGMMTTIVGCDVDIYPAGNDAYINGEKQAAAEVLKKKAAMAGATDDEMAIGIGDFAKYTVTKASTQATRWIITFPNATTAATTTGAITLTDGDDVVSTFTATQVEGAAKPTFYLDGTYPAENGTYTLNIPAGYFKIDSKYSTIAFEQQYAVKAWFGADEISITPAAGSTIENFHNFTVTFAGVSSITQNGANDELIFRSTDNRSFAAWDFTITRSGNTATIVPNRIPQVNTEYVFRIPEGFFSSNGIKNREVEISFNIFKPINWSTTEIYFDPTFDSMPASQFRSMTVCYGEPDEYTIDAYTFHEGDITVTYNGTAIAANDGENDIWNYEVQGNMVMVGFTNNYTTQPGTYGIEIAANAFTIGGQACPAVNHTWTVTADKQYDVQISTDGTNFGKGLYVSQPSDLAAIWVRFVGAETASVLNHYGAQIKNNDYTYIENSWKITAVQGAEIPTFKMQFTAPEDEGIYTLSINQGTFTLDGASASPAYTRRSGEKQGNVFIHTGVDVEELADNCVTIDENESYVAKNVVFSDEQHHTFTKPIIAQNVTYTRPQIDTNKWQSIVLPYEVAYADWSDKYYVLELTGTQAIEGAIEFTYLAASQPMQAHKPYLIRAKNGGAAEGEISIAVGQATVQPADEEKTHATGLNVKFIGTYEPITLQGTNVYALAGGVFKHTNGYEKTLKAFRAYLEFSVPGAQPTTLSVGAVGAETTGINDIEADNSDGSVFYDLQGRRVDNPSTGVYIMDGVKVMIKK